MIPTFLLVASHPCALMSVQTHPHCVHFAKVVWASSITPSVTKFEGPKKPAVLKEIEVAETVVLEM